MHLDSFQMPTVLMYSESSITKSSTLISLPNYHYFVIHLLLPLAPSYYFNPYLDDSESNFVDSVLSVRYEQTWPFVSSFGRLLRVRQPGLR